MGDRADPFGVVQRQDKPQKQGMVTYTECELVLWCTSIVLARQEVEASGSHKPSLDSTIEPSLKTKWPSN